MGLEQALTPAWPVKMEYDHLHFRRPRLDPPPTVQFPPFCNSAGEHNASSKGHVAKKGSDYHFGAEPGTAQWGDVLLHSKAFDTVPPIAHTAGGSYGGSRHWLSRGRFQRNRNAVPYAREQSHVTAHGPQTGRSFRGIIWPPLTALGSIPEGQYWP
ncbi:hypothetical protein ACVWZV_008946 [Bradyrhizobium sp. GM5.1]